MGERWLGSDPFCSPLSLVCSHCSGPPIARCMWMLRIVFAMGTPDVDLCSFNATDDLNKGMNQSVRSLVTVTLPGGHSDGSYVPALKFSFPSAPKSAIRDRYHILRRAKDQKQRKNIKVKPGSPERTENGCVKFVGIGKIVGGRRSRDRLMQATQSLWPPSSLLCHHHHHLLYPVLHGPLNSTPIMLDARARGGAPARQSGSSVTSSTLCGSARELLVFDHICLVRDHPRKGGATSIGRLSSSQYDYALK
ncbi:hypothetical protein H6P81_004817 [Aristolochia fimbriata]|uniref:Uncharacterized protein n=1 Tax=Aristolochia fimbriata TaxID=158543 RepID=A0AAV7EST9_ARIFI|nr:hypothetical protein H6P81_004817 [Aristolochia fimbriata]